MKILINKKKLAGGYTIIETMIALSIFLIVIVIGVGALLNAHLVNRKSQDMRSIMDSLSFAMEDMSRNIRTGYQYQCLDGPSYISENLGVPTSCPNGGWGISFESSEGDIEDNNDQWVYFVLKDANGKGKLFRSTLGLNNVDDAVQMTPDEIDINNFNYNFSVIGAESNDGQQPFVVIRLVGKITSRAGETPFSLQTVVSQRLSDI